MKSLIPFILLIALAEPGRAQQTPAQPQAAAQLNTSTKLVLTTASAAARDAFYQAWDEGNNEFPSRALPHITRALELDSTFGLARIMYSQLAPNLTAAQRHELVRRGLSDAARAGPHELAVAAAMAAHLAVPTITPTGGLYPGSTLANLTNVGPNAAPINAARTRAREAAQLSAKAATVLLPDDPYVAYFAIATAPTEQRLDLLRDIVRRFPDFAPAHNLIALRLTALGDTAGAIAAAGEYMRLLPNHPNAHDRYARAILMAKREDEAIRHFEEAIRLEPRHVPGYTGIADVHTDRGRPADAVPVLKRALAVDSAFAAARMALVNAYVALGQFDEARTLLLRGNAARPVTQPTVVTIVSEINVRRQAAMIRIYEGSGRQAIRELTEISTMQGAEPGMLAVAYRDLALAEAAFGDARRIAEHVARGASAPSPAAATQIPPMRVAGLAYAMSAQIDSAVAVAGRLAAVADSTTAANLPAQANARNNAIGLNAVIAVARKNVDAARAEVEKLPDNAQFALHRVLFAELLKASGQTAEARAIKARILALPPALEMTQAIARVRAQRL